MSTEHNEDERALLKELRHGLHYAMGAPPSPSMINRLEASRHSKFIPPESLTELDVDVYQLPNISSQLGLEVVMKCPASPTRNRWLEVDITNAEPELVDKLEVTLRGKGLHWKFAAKVGDILIFT